jgi:bacteriocin-like protein
MSNELKNNLKAIELTENDLDNIVGGNLGIASAGAQASNAGAASNSAAAAQMQASNQIAILNMQVALANAMNKTIKNIGRSVKSAAQ